MTEPAKWLDVEAASRHVSMRADVFLRAVARGKLPKPSLAMGKRTPRWDRDEIDARIAGVKTNMSVRSAVDGLVAEIKAEGRTGRQAKAA